MAKHLGIDIGAASVRAVLVRTSYRRVAIEAVGECDIASAPSLVEAIRIAAAHLVVQGESLATCIDGEKMFVRSVELPPTAMKQLGEVLPFEIESQLPIEFSEAVFDHTVLRRASSDDPVRVLAAVARIDDVRERIELVREALGVEPEKVGCGGFSLASLSGIVPELAAQGPIAVLDVGELRSELIVLELGDPTFARTVSRGTAGLPASAPALARELRQTLAAWRASGGAAVEIVYLTGPGAHASGAAAFLESEIGISVLPLPEPRVDPMPPDQLSLLPRYAKALGLAMGLVPRTRGMNLRKGPLTYERGYGFLRDKIPVLSGLSAVILVSFFFSSWAELRSLGSEREMLEGALGTLSHDVFGEETKDPARAMELLERGPGGADEDPFPHADAFDVMVQIAQAVPESMTHDIEELDVQRSHATIHGIVPSIPDAQAIAGTLKNFKCFQDVKVVRTNQVVGEDRQKYVLELEVKCPTEGKEAKDKAAAAGSASPAGSASAGGKP